LGIFGFLLSAQRTSYSKPRGSPWSSPLRSNGSRDDQAGEAGLVEQSSVEAESLKAKGQGTVWLPLTAEAARQGAIGLLSRHIHWKKRELKAALHWSTKRAKGSPPKKKHYGLKRKNAYSRLQKLLLQKVRVKSMWMWMNENQGCWPQVNVTAFWCLRVKSQKWS
jgi:hypothetical protein